VSRCSTMWRCDWCLGAYQLSTIFHTAFLFQRCRSFLSPIMASSNDPFRTPQSTTPAFESGDLRVSDQFFFISVVFPRVFSTFPPLCLRFPSFSNSIFSPLQRRSMFVATLCESVGFVGYRNTYAHTQRSRRVFPGCIYHSRLCSESRIP
jgi:hypothetical protein